MVPENSKIMLRVQTRAECVSSHGMTSKCRRRRLERNVVMSFHFLEKGRPTRTEGTAFTMT